MTISPLALKAKTVIESEWLHGAPYDLASQAAFALESAQMLMSPETAAEIEGLRARVAELEALKPAPIQTCRECGAGYTYGEPCSTCAFRARMASELQARGLDGEHYAAVHHEYRTPHDMPQPGAPYGRGDCPVCALSIPLTSAGVLCFHGVCEGGRQLPAGGA